MVQHASLDTHCDAASGFNLKIEHFLHLNRMEREKAALQYLIRFRIPWQRSGSLVYNDILLSLLYERMLRDRPALKKKTIFRSPKKKKKKEHQLC